MLNIIKFKKHNKKNYSILFAEGLAGEGPIVGIDLGTTNSVIAIYEAGTPKVIQNKNGGYTTPSVVGYSSSASGQNTCIVGQIAKRQAVLNPNNTFYSVKRLIGCKYEEIKNEIEKLSYSVLPDEHGKIRIDCPALSKSFSPEEISATILKSLAEDASSFLRKKVKQAVITVPAYFNDSQRLATKDAGAIAGLSVLRILNEPTAAALAYGLDKKKNETVLIFDLGGGTFDVSILEVGQEVFEVLSTSGDTHLGGDDFDNAIVEYIIREFQKIHGVDLYSQKQALQRIIEIAESTKISLSSAQSAQINLPFIHFINGVGQSIDIAIDRSKFEDLSKNVLEKCRQPVLQALKDANLTKSEINEVVLVGGSTRIPAVKNLLIDLLGKPLNESVNPDEVVALGAAVQAGILAGQITDLILLDVTPLSLGVEVMGGLMAPVIPKNTSVPARHTEIFSTGEDSAHEVDIHVLQGERPLAKDNKSLGIFRLAGIPPAPRGVPQIEVTFELNADGLLAVFAKEKSSGVQQSIKIEGASTLDRSEIDKMIKDAEANASIDKIMPLFASLAYEADTFFEECETNLIIKYSTQLEQNSAYCYFKVLLNTLKNALRLGNIKGLTEKFFEELQYTYYLLVQQIIKQGYLL